MRIKSACVVILAALGVWSCGSIQRIKKLPVPMEHVIRSYRLAAEADKLLEEGKDYLALLKYLESSNLNPYHEVIFNKLAIAYSRVQMFPQAGRAVQRALRLNPDYPFAWNTQGIVFLAQQDFKKAIGSFERAIQLRPEMANFYVNMGHAYMQWAKFEKGRKAYQTALEIDPNVFAKEDVIQLPYAPSPFDAERNYQMARFFAELGDKQACLNYLAKALSSGFSDRERLLEEREFDELRQDADFINLLGLYGIHVPG